MKRDTKTDGAMRATARNLRFAVYTRKSSEEGLDMDFNSLDAQREACEAFIASRRAEGWVLVRERYDDGGVSGGSLERPALKRLLADIEAGLVDVIVCYKLDRLSRSLLDFTKLVEVFDANNVTFVSVTLSFNTTTSMGRLTLNILLSFAQFEREVIGERIRDKVAASRKRGMWMGGYTPLGYDVRERKLVVNDAEAVLVPSGMLPMPPRVDVTLVKAPGRAFRWHRLLETGHYATVKDLAAGEGVNPSYASRVLRLPLLAPDIVEAILDGQQPEAITLSELMKGVAVEWTRHRVQSASN